MNDGEIWRPPPDLTISEWADEYRFLSRESSAEPGKWNTDRAPYQRGMMDAVKTCERIVIMTAAQIGKSELLLNTIGYFMHYDPCPILMLQPTLEMGESFSKDRLAPMIRDTPCLREKLPDPKSRTSGNTLLHKIFPGGHVTIAGANSPAGLASRPIRVLLCDEVDRYPSSAGTEGDPLSLAMKRTANFWNRRIVWVSTPTIAGHSRIETAYNLSSQAEWELPCPRCGTYQPLSWEQIIYKDRTQPVMKCINCGQEFTGHEWKSGPGRWNAQNDTSSIKGYHLNALASPWVQWSEIADSYHEAHESGEEALKVWTNTVLGEPYELKEGTLDVNIISSRTERYAAELPDDVQILTAGIDTQDNRLEVEIVGWAARYESYGIEYRRLYGVPGGQEVWEDLDALLSRTWKKADGSELGISCACVDAGGHFTDNVHRFVKSRSRRRIFAVIGRGTFGHPCISGPSRNNRMKVPVFMLGVNTLKGMLFSRLQAERGEPGYCHFPDDKSRGYDEVYFAGLLSERMTLHRSGGRDVIVWEKRREHIRNEPLDCRVYATGAYEILNPKLTAKGTKITPSGQVQNHSERVVKNPVQKPRKMSFRRGLSL